MDVAGTVINRVTTAWIGRVTGDDSMGGVVAGSLGGCADCTRILVRTAVFHLRVGVLRIAQRVEVQRSHVHVRPPRLILITLPETDYR